jgi:LysM repeat protein
MKNFVTTLLLMLLAAVQMSAQNAATAVNLYYQAQHMDILDYRLAFSGGSNHYYAFSVKGANGDRFILYAGNGFQSDNLPLGTKTFPDLPISDALIKEVNSVQRQMFVVQQLQRGYTVLPITAITKIAKTSSFYVVNAPMYSFILDTANLVMGRQLAMAGSQASVTLNSFGVKNCRNAYSFTRTPQQVGGETAEFEFLPGLGISMERSGRNASEMQANQIVLWGVNGMTLEEYINKSCGGKSATATAPPPPNGWLPGSTAPAEPRPEEAANMGTGAGNSGAVLMSAISNYPAVSCPKMAAAPGFHIVQRKETLNGIARFYGVTAEQIRRWNNIKDVNKIEVCMELRVSDPTKTAKSPAKAPIINGTPATGTQQVVLPPAKQPETNYTPTQPAPQQPLPGLFGNGQYQAPQPIPSQPAPQAQQGIGGSIHVVQPGEGIYSIAKMYGYTEERFRRMNGMPATGDPKLQPGQKLRVSDCEVFVSPENSSVKNPALNTPQPGAGLPDLTKNPVASTPPTVVPDTKPSTGGLQPIVDGALPDLTRPVEASTPTNTQPAGNQNTNFVPIGGNPASTGLTQPEAPKAPAKEPIGFTDYYVKDSESIIDIARKKKLDATELSLINNVKLNEILPPGTKIQLPIY